jgi:hypothetical protein
MIRALVAATWLFGLYLMATGQLDPIAHGVEFVTSFLQAGGRP